MSVIFKCQKSFRCNQILYRKTINKDHNDTEKCKVYLFIFGVFRI
ncbi:unnamed protein product [Tenebrio molitor]|nr:unnamed protein product [Tenebrio molitor]